MSQTIRINNRLYELAKHQAEGESRSIAGQIEYWALVGRAALDNPDLPIEMIRDVIIARAEKSEWFEFDETHNSND